MHAHVTVSVLSVEKHPLDIPLFIDMTECAGFYFIYIASVFAFYWVLVPQKQTQANESVRTQ